MTPDTRAGERKPTVQRNEGARRNQMGLPATISGNTKGQPRHLTINNVFYYPSGFRIQSWRIDFQFTRIWSPRRAFSTVFLNRRFCPIPRADLTA